MQNYRITSFLIFTTLFFVVEVIFALAFWIFLSTIYGSSHQKTVDHSRATLLEQRKKSAKLTSNDVKRENEYDDEYEDEDQQRTITCAEDRDSIKIEEGDDSPQGSSQTFPAFPQRRHKYSSTSSTSTPRSWSRSRSLSATNAAVRIKKEDEEEDGNGRNHGSEEGEDQSTYDSNAGRSAASSSGHDNDPGVWSWRLERQLDAQRRQKAARRRKS